MKKSNHTLRALVASILATAMFSAMFVGSTYAWFTDTATTGVNTIQSGTLDVALVDENDQNIEGQTLDFISSNPDFDPAVDEILWEPGVTFKLPDVKIVNNGNLALKYKINFNGFTGDTELLDVIDFTVKLNDTVTDLSTFEGHLLPGADSGVLSISGHMQETAGNDYQNKTLTGAAITVYATQDTVEYDSFTNEYDSNAAYPSVVNTTAGFTTAMADPTVKEVVLTKDVATTGSTVMSDTTLNGNGNTITVSNTGSGCGIAAKSGTIENVTITGNGRGLGVGSNGTHMDGDLYVKNVTIDGPTYAMNIGNGDGHKVVVEDSTLRGWTSMSGVDATFNNVTFERGTKGDAQNYAYFAFWTSAFTFNDCTFSDDFCVFGRNNQPCVLNFNNCTHGGTAVTAANFTTMFDTPHDSDFDYLWNQSEIYVNGVRVNP